MHPIEWLLIGFGAGMVTSFVAYMFINRIHPAVPAAEVRARLQRARNNLAQAGRDLDMVLTAEVDDPATAEAEQWRKNYLDERKP